MLRPGTVGGHREGRNTPAAGPLCAPCVTGTESAFEGPGQRPSTATLLDGKYRLLEEVGRGGMGSVFRALDEPLDRLVAVKFLRTRLFGEAASVRRFRAEARAMASVRHENVVQVYAAGEASGAEFIVLEYIDGVTADRLVRNARRRCEHLPLTEALRIGWCCCAGLAAVHQAGVVHRDVKPGNIMVERGTGRVVLMDFGLGWRQASCSFDDEPRGAGTPAYMAPEVVEDRVLDAGTASRADLYALGASLFELVTGRPPFRGKTWVETLQQHVTLPPPRPSLLRPDLPEGLEDVLLWPLEKDPRQRPEEALELLDALEAFLLGATAEGRLTRRPSSKRPTAWDRKGLAPSSWQIVLSDPDPSVLARLLEVARKAIPRACVCGADAANTALDLAARTAADLLVVPIDAYRDGEGQVGRAIEDDPRLARTRLAVSAPRPVPRSHGGHGPVVVPSQGSADEIASALEEALAEAPEQAVTAAAARTGASEQTRSDRPRRPAARASPGPERPGEPPA